MLTLNINTDNDAFTPYVLAECARILRDTASMLEHDHIKGVLRDYNGNVVGNWNLELEEGDGDL